MFTSTRKVVESKKKFHVELFRFAQVLRTLLFPGLSSSHSPPDYHPCIFTILISPNIPKRNLCGRNCTAIGRRGKVPTNQKAAGKMLKKISMRKIMHAKSFCGFGVGNELKITFVAISLETAKRAINCDHFGKSSQRI